MTSETPETSVIRADPAIPGLGALWLCLAVAYLAASASGHRGIALAVVGLMIGALMAASGRRMAGSVTGLALSSACLYWADSLLLVAYMPPIAGFAFMAFFFQRTLRRGSEPLITRVARKEHPDLPTEIERYTRTLTWVWSGCFASLLVAALVFAVLLPLDSWSRWMQGLGILVPATLFLGEYIYRHRRLPDHHHASLPVLVLNSIAVIKEAAVKPANGRSGTADTSYRR